MKKRKHRRRNRKRQKQIFRIITMLVLTAAIALVSTAAYILHERAREAEETPLESPLLVHDYDWSYLTIDGSYAYYEDDNYTSMQGIDVSSHNGSIDWVKVKEAGIEFVFIRCGYRGYEEGIIHADSSFYDNIEQAQAGGLKVGVYFFSQAVNVTEAREEAEFTLRMIQGYDLDLPVVYDMEKAGEGDGRVDNLSREEWTQNAATFLHIIRNAGYEPMIYNSSSLFEKYFRIEYLQEFKTWVAHYNSSYPSYPYQFEIWQYSSTGQVDGISTNTDMNIMFIKKEQD